MVALKVTGVERITLDVPFNPMPQKHMRRELANWSVTEVCKVTSDAGLVGWGETIVNYTWGRVSDASVDKVMRQNPFEHLWDDGLGAGLQMALFDLCGKAAGVPMYRLLGPKVRDWAPISWWAIDMPPEDWASEAQEAVRRGYTSFKIKARPWFDIFEQVKAISEVTPPHFKLDADFNSFLLNAANAVPVLTELSDFEKVVMFETPIPQGDVEGNKQIRKIVPRPIAHHYGSPPIMTALKEDVCDGFVIGGGVTSTLRQATLSAQAGKPFWLQLVGTGLTTAFAIHLGAVCTHAQWPAITCLNLYSEDLIIEPLTIQGGYARVPEAPGLGVEVDEDAVERFRVEPPVEKKTPRWVLTVAFASGLKVHFADSQAYHREFYASNLPVTHRGVTLKVWEDDGSKEFRELYERVQSGPVREGS